MRNKILVLLLAVLVVFNVSTSALVYANGNFSNNFDVVSQINGESLFVTRSMKNQLNKNLNEAYYLSNSNKDIVHKVFNNPNRYIIENGSYNDSSVMLFTTPKANINISVTDGLIEVVEKISDSEFLINGKLLVFNLSYEEESAIRTSGWVEIGDPGGNWRYLKAGYYNYNVSGSFATVSFGVLISVISSTVGGPAGLALSISASIAAGLYTVLANSNIGRSYVVEYEHQTLPTIYKKYISNNYASYNGGYTLLGSSTTYYTWIPGGL